MGAIRTLLVVGGVGVGAICGSQLGNITHKYATRADAHQREAVTNANQMYADAAQRVGVPWDPANPVEGLDGLSKHYLTLAKFSAKEFGLGGVTISIDGLETKVLSADGKSAANPLAKQEVEAHLDGAGATKYLAHRVAKLGYINTQFAQASLYEKATGLFKGMFRKKNRDSLYDSELMNEVFEGVDSNGDGKKDGYVWATPFNKEGGLGAAGGAGAGGVVGYLASLNGVA